MATQDWVTFRVKDDYWWVEVQGLEVDGYRKRFWDGYEASIQEDGDDEAYIQSFEPHEVEVIEPVKPRYSALVAPLSPYKDRESITAKLDRILKILEG